MPEPNFPCPVCGQQLRKGKGSTTRYICDNPNCPVIEVDALTKHCLKPKIKRIKYDSRFEPK